MTLEAVVAIYTLAGLEPPMMTPRGIGNAKQPGGFMPQVWGV